MKKNYRVNNCFNPIRFCDYTYYKVEWGRAMPFLFENPIGVIIGILLLSFGMLLSGVSKKWTETEILISVVLFIVWYILTVILNKVFPGLGILRENKLVYAIASAIILKIARMIVQEHFY